MKFLQESYEKKGQIIVGDCGKVNGVQTYRVNGYKEDLENVIFAIENDLGLTFAKPPEIKKTFPTNFFTVLLEIQLEIIGVGAYDNKNQNTNERKY